MAYEDEGGSPGSVPEYGAIFMASSATKKECFKRKLLALPPAQANFVKQVKAGMILFLFEFEKRELYGVYQATSDGAMNIAPHAFDSSGRQFPAQVHFKVIWYCKPLREHEFQEAIIENYFSNKKFNFGLSEDQVRRLLSLFSSRKSDNRVPRQQIGGPTSLTGKENANKRNQRKYVEEDNPVSSINSGDYQRLDNEMFAGRSPGYDALTAHEGSVLGRRKRIAEDSMDLTEDQLGLDYEEHTLYQPPITDGNLRDTLYSSSRHYNENQFLSRYNFENEDDDEKSMVTSDFLARRDLRDDIGQIRDTRDKHSQSSDVSFRLGKQAERFGSPQSDLRRPVYDQRLFMDQKVDYDHNSVGDPDSISRHRVSNTLAKVRRVPNDYEQNRTGRSVDNAIPQIVCDRLDTVRRVTDGRKQIPAEQFSNRLNYGGISNYEESLTNVGNSLGHITSAVHTEHPLGRRINQLNDKHILRKGDGLEKVYPTGSNVGLPTATGYADVYETRQQKPSFSSSKPKLEAHYSLSQNQHKSSSLFPSSVDQRMYATSYSMENQLRVSNPTSGDVALTRSLSYDPDFPEVNVTSPLVKDFIPHQDLVGDDFAVSIKKSPYYTVAENLSSQSDGSFRRVNEVSMHGNNKDLYDQYDCRLAKSFLSGGYREKMEQPSINNEIYEDSVSNDFQDLLVKYGMDRANLGTSFQELNDYDIKSNQDPDALCTDFRNRTSVFARLSVPSTKHVSENDDYMDQDVLDASVDEVMETVYECMSHKITKANKHSLLSKRHNKEGTGTLGSKKREKTFIPKEDIVATKYDNKPPMVTQKTVIESKPATSDEKNADQVLRETRVVEFKRRSEKIRGSAQKPEDKREEKEEGEPLKRRKLIRPVFAKKEKLIDDSQGDKLSSFQLTSSENNGASCEFSGTILKSSNSQIQKNLAEPVFSEKDELKNVSTKGAYSSLQIASSENKDPGCEFSGSSLGNLNSPSPRSCKRLVRPPFGKKEELHDDSKKDGVSSLRTHGSSNDQKAAFCEFAGENMGNSDFSSPNSGSLGSNPK